MKIAMHTSAATCLQKSADPLLRLMFHTSATPAFADVISTFSLVLSFLIFLRSFLADTSGSALSKEKKRSHHLNIASCIASPGTSF